MPISPEASRDCAWLALIAIAGQVLVTVLTAFLARALSLQAFETFAVAFATFMLLVKIAPLGTDKLAVKKLPPMLYRADWAKVRGFLRFALRHAGLGTVLVAATGSVWAFGLRDLNDTARWVFLLAMLLLPVGVFAQIGLEATTAFGAVRFGAAMLRLAVPALTLVLVALAYVLGLPLTSVVAFAAWGIGWIVAAVSLLVAILNAVPAATWRLPPAMDRGWGRAAKPAWAYGIAAALLAQTAIIALDWLGEAPETVGAYASAATIVGLLLVMSTSTNRAYAREIAVHVAEGDADGMRSVLRRRRRWMVPAIGVVLIVIFAFSRQILTVFRPEFVEDGLWPLRILGCTAAVTMYFGLAPTVLKYAERTGPLFAALAVAAALQIMLLVLLVPPLGATGAALAYALSATLMFGLLGKFADDAIRALSITAPMDGARRGPD